jgi:hypothetical protein
MSVEMLSPMRLGYVSRTLMKAILCYNNKRCKMGEDEFKTLNRSIVPTCWDGRFSAHILDWRHLCEYGGGTASYETLASL